MIKVTKLGKYRIITFDSENPRESQATHFQVRFPSDVFSCDFLICIHVWRVFSFYFLISVHVSRVFFNDLHLCSCVACVHVWRVFFNNFLVRSCVACVFQWLFDMCSCVACVIQWFSSVFMRGACFSMIFLCVHVWCAFLLFSGGPQTNRWFCRGGGGSNLLQIHPNVKLSAYPEATYKLHGTLCIQEISAVSAKNSKTAWRRYSKHVMICVQTMIFTMVTHCLKKFRNMWDLSIRNCKTQCDAHH